MNAGGYGEYQSVDLLSRACAASPHELVLVLFDGLLDEIDRVRGHIEARRFNAKGRSVEKCLNILDGLNSVLDLESGGELVLKLSRLYNYCSHRLCDVSVNLSVGGLDEVTHLLNELREGWEGMVANHG